MTINQAKITALEWKMAIAWFVLFSVNSLGSCMLAASAGSVWSSLGTQERLTVITAVVVNWTGTIMAWISKSAKKLSSGENPIVDDGTIAITKQQTQTTEIK